ncbi:protein HTATIP2-like [Oratosquilla oratoria]|uniref:protein HTATIP2-like n=1 Tax=Oratosquilla oratoria TaxID=337810 RepID=UPI003F76BA7D
MTEAMTALVLGGSGEVGKKLVQELVTNPSFARVILITRRELEIPHEKVEQRIVDFNQLDQYREAFEGTEVGYCCIGTTKAKAGAQGFVKVDRDYVINAARLAKEAGCRHFHVISSTGANPNSKFLYMKTKGECEKFLTELNLPRLSIYRPSILLCARQEARPLEWVAQVFLKGFDWRNKISIDTETVARAMVANTFEPPQAPTHSENPIVEIFENTDILRLGID